MSTSYLMSMPILIYNLGVEMIYVLCSRLKAQNIAEDKCSKVIHDVVLNLFDIKFMHEIQKKQEIAKHLAVRQLFDKLVHSSIMRLNTSSMNKLFDLMLMSIKVQLVKTKFPEEIFQITMNHLNALVEILQNFDQKNNLDAITVVKENIAYVNRTYSKMSPYEYTLLRQTLLRFFQGKNVKVSIFIQDNLQSKEGVIKLSMEEIAPPAVKKPGLVVKYKSTGEVDKEYVLQLNLSEGYKPSNSLDRVNTFTTELGANIYISDRKNKEYYDPLSSDVSNNTNIKCSNTTNTKLAEEVNKISNNPTLVHMEKTNSVAVNNIISQTLSSPSNISDNSYNYLNDSQLRKDNINLVKKEFGQLADLLNVNTNNKLDENQIFKFDLFKIKDSDKAIGNKKSEYTSEGEDFIEIERLRDYNLDKLRGMFDDININKTDEEDDLLELMDLAANK